MEHFVAKSADVVWRKAAERLLLPGGAELQKGRGGPTHELLRAVFEIQNPRKRWVFSRNPAINPAFAIVELICLMNGRNDAEVLNFWNPALPRFAGRTPTYQGAYGFRLKRNFGFDQLDRAYRALKENPDTRQVVLQIWDPGKDFPTENGNPADPDIACNICALLKVRDERLEWTQVVRSNDLLRGIPYDFAQFMALQEILAGWLGLHIGTYVHLSDSLHVYQADLSKFRCVPHDPEPLSQESLALPYDECLETFARLSALLDILRDPHIGPLQMHAAVMHTPMPQPFKNLLLVVAADASRRRLWKEAEDLMAACSNPVLVRLWRRWVAACNTRATVSTHRRGEPSEVRNRGA